MKILVDDLTEIFLPDWLLQVFQFSASKVSLVFLLSSRVSNVSWCVACKRPSWWWLNQQLLDS